MAKAPLFVLLNPAEQCEALGASLRRRRLAQNMTLAELSLRAGISRISLGLMERTGQASLLNWVTVMNILAGVSFLEVLLEEMPTSLDEVERLERASVRKRASGKERVRRSF